MFTSPNPLIFLLLVISLLTIDSSRETYTSTLRSSPEKFDTYVDNMGVGDEKGTIDLPYHTISKAIEKTTGQYIKVRAGNDYNEPIKITKPIHLIGESFATIKPRIVGGDGPIVSIDASDVVVDGFEITNGSFLKPPLQSTSTDTTGIKVEPGSERVAITHNRIHTIGRNYDKTCKCDPESDCPCAGQAHGINVRSYAAKAIKDVTIADNELFNLHLGRSEAIALNGNVSSFLVARNYIHDVDNIGIDIGGLQDSKDPQDQANRGRAADNTISFVFASLVAGDPHFNPGQATFKDDTKTELTVILMGAIYVDGGTNVTVESNVVHDSATGIDVGSEKGATVADVVVRNNLIYSNKSAGIKIGNGEVKAVVNSRFTNNTLVNNNYEGYDNGSIYFGTEDAKKFCNITIANNLVARNNERTLVGSAYKATIVYDSLKKKCENKTCDPKKATCSIRFILNGFYPLNSGKFHSDADNSYASFSTLFGNQVVDFKLFPLDLSFYLLPKTPAIDAGDNSMFPGCESNSKCVDGAGRTRIVNTRIDLGAFELN